MRQVGDVKYAATVGRPSISVGVVCTSVTKASFGGNESQIAVVSIRTVRWRAAPDIGRYGLFVPTTQGGSIPLGRRKLSGLVLQLCKTPQ